MNLKNKKIIIISAVIVGIIGIGIFMFCNMSVEKTNNEIANNAITPAEEISDEQLRETTINLYYINNNNEIAVEMRKVDSKILLNDPYKEVMNLLVQGPISDSLRTAFPENVTINNIQKNGDCLVIDFSREFIENQKDDVEIQGLVISQIVNTAIQFTEINSIKILINGEENLSFKGGNINFRQIFTHED